MGATNKRFLENGAEGPSITVLVRDWSTLKAFPKDTIEGLIELYAPFSAEVAKAFSLFLMAAVALGAGIA
jgi:hypothetical protein